MFVQSFVYPAPTGIQISQIRKNADDAADSVAELTFLIINVGQ